MSDFAAGQRVLVTPADLHARPGEATDDEVGDLIERTLEARNAAAAEAGLDMPSPVSSGYFGVGFTYGYRSAERAVHAVPAPQKDAASEPASHNGGEPSVAALTRKATDAIIDFADALESAERRLKAIAALPAYALANVDPGEAVVIVADIRTALSAEDEK